ncbi:hypothetical protein FFF34_009210 [Inquilinus sp. KBS0705]|nr:hypothetical protein FFF34_009210 [Inquilinus sp. KBS0705]
MKSLYNDQDNLELISRIDKLNASTPGLWGKMSVSQMLAHCQVPIQIAFEELTLKRNLLGYLFGGMAKKKLMGDAPFGKNLPTFKQARMKHERDFNFEKGKLTNYIRRIAIDGPEGITKKTHPFFGHLTTHEWDKLLYKHLDHHLQQFGV